MLVSEVTKLFRELLRFCCYELLLWEAGSCGWVQFENPEEAESLPLETVTRQRLVKTQQAENTEVCAVVNYEVCESAKWL
jgi:hypothetical protein